jgi:ribonuclease P protein component
MILESIKADYAFRRLRKGRAGYAKYLVVRWLPDQKGCIHVGIIVSKKVGKAVQRNLVRRRLREALLAILAERPLQERAKFKQEASFDLLIVAKPEASQASFILLKASLRQALEHGKLLQS